MTTPRHAVENRPAFTDPTHARAFESTSALAQAAVLTGDRDLAERALRQAYELGTSRQVRLRVNWGGLVLGALVAIWLAYAIKDLIAG